MIGAKLCANQEKLHCKIAVRTSCHIDYELWSILYVTFEGYVSKSKSKVKCKKKENGKYKWNADELSKCITCDPEKLKFEDDSEGLTDS